MTMSIGTSCYLLGRCDFGERWFFHGLSTVFQQSISQFWWMHLRWDSSIVLGNPLSPFLFVIVMDALSRILDASVGGGFLASFSVGGVNISHLLFVDDTLLCSEAVLGLKVNYWSLKWYLWVLVLWVKFSAWLAFWVVRFLRFPWNILVFLWGHV